MIKLSGEGVTIANDKNFKLMTWQYANYRWSIRAMTIAQIENFIRYVTNAEGKTTDVLVPLELWQQLIHSLNTDNISRRALIDEQEPKQQILADLQESVRLASAGQTFPVSQLWEDSTA